MSIKWSPADLRAEMLSQQALQRLNQLGKSEKELRLIHRRFLPDLEQTVARFNAFLNKERKRQKKVNAVIAPVVKYADPR